MVLVLLEERLSVVERGLVTDLRTCNLRDCIWSISILLSVRRLRSYSKEYEDMLRLISARGEVL